MSRAILAAGLLAAVFDASASRPPTPPIINLVAPASYATVYGPVTLTATVDPNGSKLTKLEYQVDGVKVGACASGKVCSVTWSSSAAKPGYHRITAVAENSAGYTATSPAVYVYMAIPTPDVKIVAPAANTNVAGLVRLTATVDLKASTLASLHYEVDGVKAGTCDPGAVCSVTWDALLAQSGVHRIRAIASNVEGKTGYSPIVEVRNPAPIVKIIAPVADSHVTGPVTLTATVDLQGTTLASVHYEVDSVKVGTCAPRTVCSVTWDASLAKPRIQHWIAAVASNVEGKTGRASVAVSNLTPIVDGIAAKYTGYFLKDTQVVNTVTAAVRWQGLTPGTVSFEVSGGDTFVVPATATGAQVDLNMARDFEPSRDPTFLTVRAISAEKIASAPVTKVFFVYEYPPWVHEALRRNGSLTPRIGVSEVTYAVEADYPEPHLAEDGPLDLPEWIPFLGGRFGLSETYGRLRGEVTSKGTGTFTICGKTGFAMAGGSITGKVQGGGDFRLGPPKGLEITRGFFGAELGAEIERTAALDKVIPGVRKLTRIPVAGPYIRSVIDSAELAARFSPAFALDASFEQDNLTSKLRFDEGTGTLTLKGDARVNASFSNTVKAEAWFEAAGQVTAGVPERHGHFMREVELALAAGAELDVHLLKFSAEATYTVKCGYTAGGATCDAGKLESSDLVDGSRNVRVEPIRTDYARFGAYSAVTASNESSAVVTNVFESAQPRLVELPGGPMLLWVHQNPSLPPLQATDIAWIRHDGTSWSAPRFIQADTRAEMSPVAGVDARGNVVAVWLRVKDSAFSRTVQTADDLPHFYSQFEVVSAVFDAAANQWHPETALTNDAAADTDLRLSRDPSGKLMLTWITTEGSSSATSAVRVSFWNGSSWSAPVAIASGSSEISTHAAAVHGDAAFVVVSRDPDPDVAGDGVLDLHTWNGTAWSAAPAFAAGGGDHRFPAVSYDASGAGHVFWLRGADLVHATLGSAAPQVVRTTVNPMDVWSLALLPDASGHLNLVWLENHPDGTATLETSVFDTSARTEGEAWPLSDGAGTVHQTHAVYGASGQVRVAYVSTGVVPREVVVTVGGKPVTIPDVPSDGRSDVHVSQRLMLTDLALRKDDLTFDPPKPRQGETAMANITVHNAGPLATPSFAVALFAGAPEKGGTLLGAVSVDPMASGERRKVSLSFVNPGGTAPLVAIADLGGTVREYDETNNRATAAKQKRRAVTDNNPCD